MPISDEPYPTQSRGRDDWIVPRRPAALQSARDNLDVWHPQQILVESEPDESGRLATVATLFLTNRECPWRCLMCDLWQHTTRETVPIGAIPTQIESGLNSIRNDDRWRDAEVRHIKLYNSGSFFDGRAIAPEDDAIIAAQVGSFARVVVESHPKLVGARCAEFATRLRDVGGAKLEVAMGLETVHPVVLDLLNKGANLDDFRRAADFLHRHDIALRFFVLVRPPFMNEAEGLEWACLSLDFAFKCGASAVALIPTRGGNGALEALAAQGQFSPPQLSSLEAAFDYGIAAQRARVFVDEWDLERFASCCACFAARRTRLETMNRSQKLLPLIECAECNRIKVL